MSEIIIYPGNNRIIESMREEISYSLGEGA